MVLRKPVSSYLQPASQPYPPIPASSPTSSLYSPPSNTGSVPDTSLNKNSQHESQSLRNEDSSSDWDASDREDNVRRPRAEEDGTREDAAMQTLQSPNLTERFAPDQDSNLNKSRKLTPPQSPSPQPAELNSLGSSPPNSNHQTFSAEGLDTLVQNLSVSANSHSTHILPGGPLSPGGRTNTNPFRRVPSNELASSTKQTSNPQAALAPTNPFRQLGPTSIPDLISFDSNAANYKPSATEQPGLPHSDNTVASPEVPVQSRTRVRASSIFDAEEQAGLSQPVSHTTTNGVESGAPAGQAASTTQNLLRNERNKVYQIRKILWKDPTTSSSLRESPILIQNANGPCPLLALVNALVLSTPPSIETALIETLRTRENISLGLLLDAVFDELMSGRRGTTALQLPDVHQLYTFLLALHNGMNVNPRFVQEQGDQVDQVGRFEQTSEMVLYGTFDLLLTHGWLPVPGDLAHAAFARSAPSYDDAQSLLFREDELEKGLSSGQLDAHDEAAFMDLSVIKQFLTKWPTQLSSHGLSVINDTIRPCQVGILFRNDHFSTIYKEPSSGRLMTLVTDAGFASHAAVVWESLIDVNGSGSEFFSGDFRPVSHAEREQRETAPSSAQPRTRQSVGQSNRPVSPIAQQNETPASTRSTSEQEDHDLALAMQLQEEEDERDRRDQAARRRDERLSEQYLSQDSIGSHEQHGPSIPPRRSQQSTAPTAQHENNTDVAPPTYEESRRDRPYHPPPGAPTDHGPHHAGSSSDNRRTSRRMRNSSGGAVPLGGSSAMAEQRSPYMTTHEAVSDRREGCTVQ